MLDIGLSELLIILAVALIVLGPKKLPEVARSLGRGLAQFRRASDDLRRSILVEDSYRDGEDSATLLSSAPSDPHAAPPLDVAGSVSPSGPVSNESAAKPSSEDLPPKNDGTGG